MRIGLRISIAFQIGAAEPPLLIVDTTNNSRKKSFSSLDRMGSVVNSGQSVWESGANIFCDCYTMKIIIFMSILFMIT